MNLLTLVDNINQGMTPTCKMHKEINCELYTQKIKYFIICLNGNQKKKGKSSRQLNLNISNAYRR